MQWSFSNKANPQNHLSFKGQENHNNKPKIGFESLASAGLVTITTNTEVDDTIHRPYSTQIGSQYSSNQTHHQANLISTGKLNSAQITSPISTHHVPTRSSVVGTTELRGAPKTSSGPAQLTLFYAGSVCVYDNISPEKAQAIMLLAGNAPPVTPSTTSTTSPVQTIPKPPSLDAFVNVSKCHGTSPTNFSSTIPITSRGTSQSVGVFNNSTNETTIIRSIGFMKSPSNLAELSKIITPQEYRPPSHNLSAVPQARKASLTRFLEKRKERVVSASPYAISKQSYMTTSGSNNWSFLTNSAGSTPLLPATN
ncbi:unnamed protein product [Withania somnifera]